MPEQRLIPLNQATCPHCRGKVTKRVGFAPEVGGSVWRCEGSGCGKSFVVRALALVKKPG